MDAIRLTQTVKKGGCAAKIPAAELREVLQGLQFPPRSENLIVDASLLDDAAVYKINSDQALVQTLDFFTPIVDSPELFGKLAAANALSDVYAMGGSPKTCLGILAYPLGEFDRSLVQSILQGACDKINEAGAELVGGHSIDDESLKFGLSVTGFVRPDSIWTNSGAKEGDLLLLTKALGTGTLAAGLKRAQYSESDIQEALDSMTQLNLVPEILSEDQRRDIHAATDITGFGLSGHSLQMARASGVSLQIEISKVPRLDKAMESLEREHLTKAHATNRRYTSAASDFSKLNPLEELILHDPQTSGGLLLSVNPDRADEILTAIKLRFPKAALIGKVIQSKSREVLLFE